MDKSELAASYFRQGYNCAQAVALAFCEDFGYTKEQAARLISGFGGGFGRMREVCGALSGAVWALNLKYGYSDPGDPEAKAALYTRIQSVCRAFADEMGSLLCRELLNRPAETSPVADARDAAFYEKRPCLRAVCTAAALAEKMLEKE